MINFDEYSLKLLEEAKRFLEKAKTENSDDGVNAYLNASLLLSFCSLEAFINSIVCEFCDCQSIFTVYEKAFLKEKKVCFKHGEFIISNELKMSRLKERIELLYHRFNKIKLKQSDVWWQHLLNGIDLRNELIHPKKTYILSIQDVENVLKSIISCIDILFKAVYKKKFPTANKGVDSTLGF